MKKSALSLLSFATAQAQGFRTLRKANIPTAALDARVLLAFAAQVSQKDLIVHSARQLTASKYQSYLSLLHRRARREPVARILAEREFWGLPFHLGDACLDPRQDSECIVAAALEEASFMALPRQNCRVLDIGVGSGCLLISVLYSLPNAFGLGVDICPLALTIARRNALRHKVARRMQVGFSDFGTLVKERFHIVIANPPYIKGDSIEGLAPEVRTHDPWRALYGGGLGLTSYQRLACQARTLLARNGRLIIELGAGQACDVERIFRTQGFRVVRRLKDLQGHIRGLVLACRGQYLGTARLTGYNKGYYEQR